MQRRRSFPTFLGEQTARGVRMPTLPISEPKRKLAASQRGEALESLFQEHEIDLFDISCPSVV